MKRIESDERKASDWREKRETSEKREIEEKREKREKNVRHLCFCLFLSLYILTCEQIFECVRPASCLSWIRQALSHDWQ